MLNSKWKEILKTITYAFQPIVNIHTGVAYGYEALLRNYEKSGFKRISALFDQAWSDGLLDEIHNALLIKAWQSLYQFNRLYNTKLFYNIDNRLFSSSQTKCDLPSRMLSNINGKNDNLCLELSEKYEILDSTHFDSLLNEFKKKGCRIAIDDFGTGFSSLHLLYFSRPDYVKIDRFFIQDIEKDANKRMLASSIVNIAHLIGALAIAEGVETPKEYYCCKSIGCDLVQGYLVQKPQLQVGALQINYDAVHRLNIDDKRTSNENNLNLIKNKIVYIDPIPNGSSLIQVLDRFKDNVTDTFFPVVNPNGEPLGIIREEQLRQYAYSKFGRSILTRKTLNQELTRFITKIPIVDIHASLESTLEVFAGSDTREGIILTNGTRYIGFLTAHELFRITNEKNLNAARDQNPLTRLPGNERIYEYVSKALFDQEHSFILTYFDFDNFKAYNDNYGFRQGDRVILLFAELLKLHSQSPDRFAGHVGGDDFFMGVKGAAMDLISEEVKSMAEKFRENVESFYDNKAIQNGCIRARGRDGKLQCFSLISVSAALLELPARMNRIYTTEEIGSIMAEMKKDAKRSVAKRCIRSLRHFDENKLASAGQDPNRIVPFNARAGM